MSDFLQNRQNKDVTVADSSNKEFIAKDNKNLSEKDAKTIRKFLQEIGPYEGDALRIAIAVADGKIDLVALPNEEQLALNRYMNSGISKELNTPQQLQFHRIHRSSQLCKRTADFCGKFQLLRVYESLMNFAVNNTFVEQARVSLDKIANSRTGQQSTTNSNVNTITK